MNIKNRVKSALLQIGSLIYRNSGSKVIYYHDFHDTKPHTSMSTPLELFSRHADIADSMGYRFVPEISHPSNEIEVTLDDGFRGLYENFDFFLERRIPIRIFIVSGFIGKEHYLRADEIKEMESTGMLRVGSHSKTHRNLDTLDIKELQTELQESKKELEDLLGHTVDTLCFPRGRFNDTVLDESIKAGYKKIYSCLPGTYHEHFRPGLVNRSFVQHATPSEFKAILKGGDLIYRSRYMKMHYRQKSGK